MAVPYESLFKEVQIVINNKIEEFQYFGYDAITKEDLWTYCIEKKWRKKDINELRLHEVVATIFTVTSSELINYAQVKGLKASASQMEIPIEEMKHLFHLKPPNDTEQ
ncbi:post-transcriptional regulator [Solibacillus cecembensis]|uniref:post-transcriptional regulator n=1 Tax=Solibacillus cecembensis TaxID=459347 RepID=UPI003D0380B0